MQMNVMRHDLALYLWNKLRKPTKWKLLNPDGQKKTSCVDLGWAWPLHMGWVLQPRQGCGLWVLVQNKILGDGTCVIQSQGMNGIKAPAVRWEFPRFPVLSHEFAQGVLAVLTSFPCVTPFFPLGFMGSWLLWSSLCLWKSPPTICIWCVIHFKGIMKFNLTVWRAFANPGL